MTVYVIQVTVEATTSKLPPVIVFQDKARLFSSLRITKHRPTGERVYCLAEVSVNSDELGTRPGALGGKSKT